jgi:hypothetical protein
MFDQNIKYFIYLCVLKLIKKIQIKLLLYNGTQINLL